MSLRRFLPVLLLTMLACISLPAQSAPQAEAFLGYSLYHTGDTLGKYAVPTMHGGGAQFTYNLNDWLGLTVDGSGQTAHDWNRFSIAAGPQFKMRRPHFEPFAETLVGMQHIAPAPAASESSVTCLLGGGVDIPITTRFAVRPVQLDYTYAHYDKLYPAGRTADLHALRYQAGLLFRLGLPGTVVVPVANCTAEPSTVDGGAPVKIIVAVSGFSPNRVLSYSYATTGGKLMSAGATATVDTAGLESGTYTVSAKVNDEGGHRQQSASCQAEFMVKTLQRPLISVQATPSAVNAGEPVTVRAEASSPDNRPLTSSCRSEAGRLNGSWPEYTLDTADTGGTIAIHCVTTDDRGLSAEASTTVAVASKVVRVPEKFGEIGFNRDKKRPARVDNEAKGELDRYADALAAAPEAKGVLVGHATAEENERAAQHKQEPLAEQRAHNAKNYLTQEKGVSEARLDTRVGATGSQSADLWIVPAGAMFAEAGTSEIGVVPPPAATRHHHHKAVKKHAAKKAAHHVKKAAPAQ